MAWSRRKLLAGFGGASAVAALSPFVPLFQPTARAAAPTRLLIFQTSMGMSSRYPAIWQPEGGESSLRFPAGSILEPLAGFESKLLVLNGIHNESATDQRLPGGHPVGLGNLLTAAKLVENSSGMVGGGDRDWHAHAGGPSIDQFAAGQLGTRSIEAAVSDRNRGSAATYKTRLSFRGPAEPVSPEVDPGSVFRRFWGDGEPMTPANSGRENRQRLVFDHVREELAALSQRVGADDRERIGIHLASLERAQMEIGGIATGTCSAPELWGTMNVPQTLRGHMQNIVAAMNCDLARVATIMVGAGSPHGWRFDWLPRPFAEGFHPQSHKPASSTRAQEDMISGCRWYAEQFRDLLTMLDAIPEGDGTMLDHTVVMWCTEMAEGDRHTFRNMPYVIAGGTDYFRTGRYVDCGGAPHNQLLVSVCQALGLDVERFGDRDYAQGPLSGLT
ncbi:MAG: DUF1552 domain-containing protein [Myxococcota bacterium]